MRTLKNRNDGGDDDIQPDYIPAGASVVLVNLGGFLLFVLCKHLPIGLAKS